MNEIDAICENKSQPTFYNTLEALDSCGSLISRNSSLLFNLNSAETSEALQKATQEAAPMLTKFQNYVRLNKKLF